MKWVKHPARDRRRAAPAVRAAARSAGVDAMRVVAIAVGSIATNWCGCLCVLGAMLLADPSALARRWDVSPAVGRAFGLLALAPVAAYAVAARIRRAPIRIRGSDIRLPTARLALAQTGLGSAYWLLVRSSSAHSGRPRYRAGAGPILAMLFAWRAVFLLAPLAVAAIVLFALESRGRGREVTRRAASAVRRAGQRRSRA